MPRQPDKWTSSPTYLSLHFLCIFLAFIYIFFKYCEELIMSYCIASFGVNFKNSKRRRKEGREEDRKEAGREERKFLCQSLLLLLLLLLLSC